MYESYIIINTQTDEYEDWTVLVVSVKLIKFRKFERDMNLSLLVWIYIDFFF